MVNASEIREHMEVVGADGVHVGKVDGVQGDRIKLARKDEEHGQNDAHHHFVQLSAVAANAEQLMEEEDGSSVRPGEKNQQR